jgi:hypothetical protein
MWTTVWWYRLGLTHDLSNRALWQPPVLSGGPVSRDISGAIRRMGEGDENLVFSSPWDFKISLTCRKILHGTSSFTSHPKEGVLRILIALKSPSPRPDSNPWSLGPVASTLTDTPPRRQEDGKHWPKTISLISVLHYTFRLDEIRWMRWVGHTARTRGETMYANRGLEDGKREDDLVD